MKKILFVNEAKRISACSYYRIIIPAINLNGFDVYRADNIVNMSDEDLQFFDCIYISRLDGVSLTPKIQVDRLKRLGVKYIFDIDDFWILDKTNPSYNLWLKHNTADSLTYLIRNASFVTTPSKILAQSISKLNSNVDVLYNAIDFNQDQWELKPKEDDKTVFGWIGGTSHLHDLLKLKNTFYQLHEDNKVWLSTVADNNNAGFDMFAKIFGKDKYKKFIPLLSADINNYAYLYDSLDVALVPLLDHAFNRRKSNLKAVEAGAKGKAVIATNICTYNNVLNDSNSILINHDKEWYSAINKLNDNPNLRIDLANKLHEDIKKDYDIKVVNEKRKQIIENVCSL